MNGRQIDYVASGDRFRLDVYAQEHPDYAVYRQPQGVFSGYVDVTFDTRFASFAPGVSEPEFGPIYGAFTSGDVSIDGLIDEAGASATVTNPVGGNEQLLFSVDLVAGAPGAG